MSDQIGVRELRQYASTYLARVKAGETLTVTERGRPIARIVPLDAAARDWRQDWIERGLMRPATVDRSAWLEFEPIALPEGLTSEQLIAETRQDRLGPSQSDTPGAAA